MRKVTMSNSTIGVVKLNILIPDDPINNNQASLAIVEENDTGGWIYDCGKYSTGNKLIDVSDG